MLRLQQYRTYELQEAPRDEPIRVPIFSPRLGLRRYQGLFLCADFNPSRHHTVVYLFRGHYTEWLNPKEDTSRKLPLHLRVQEATTSGQLPPLVLIMPCLGSRDNRFQTVAVNWAEPQHACKTGMGLGRYESHLIDEVIPELERSLGITNPLRIAIGFSLGGLTAFQLGLRHPGLFQHIAAYDPSFIHDPPTPKDTILQHTIFDPVFGIPRNPDLVKAHSPIWLCRRLPEDQMKRSKFYLQSGPAEAEPGGSNYERTKRFVDILRSRGIMNQVTQVVPDGQHDWNTADKFAMRILRLILNPENSAGQQPEAEPSSSEGTSSANQKD